MVNPPLFGMVGMVKYPLPRMLSSLPRKKKSTFGHFWDGFFWQNSAIEGLQTRLTIFFPDEICTAPVNSHSWLENRQINEDAFPVEYGDIPASDSLVYQEDTPPNIARNGGDK